MTFGELFAGIGGFSLGLERAGMTCKWQVEIDPYATAVLKKHWPEVPKWDDVRTFPPQGDYSVDLICGGFPCQDISVAGKGAGLAGERSGLWYEFARIIGELRPRYVVVENVAALLTRGMDAVLGTLSTLGYDAEWHVIPASAVGAPHRRERVWIVGIRRWDGEQADASCADANRVGSHRAKVHVNGSAELRHEQERFTRSLGKDVSHANCGCLHRIGTDAGDGGTIQVEGTEREFRGGDVGGDVSNAEGERRRARRPRRVAGVVSGEEDAATVADADKPGLERRDRPKDVELLGEARQVRPTRAGRVQGWDGGRWWSVEPDVGRVAHGVPARVDRLRCLGNSVVPQVVEIIGRAIIQADRGVTA